MIWTFGLSLLPQFCIVLVRLSVSNLVRLSVRLSAYHGFKNQYGQRTEKVIGYQFFGPTGVESMVRPMTS